MPQSESSGLPDAGRPLGDGGHRDTGGVHYKNRGVETKISEHAMERWQFTKHFWTKETSLSLPHLSPHPLEGGRGFSLLPDLHCLLKGYRTQGNAGPGCLLRCL